MGRELEELEEVPAGNVLGKTSIQFNFLELECLHHPKCIEICFDMIKRKRTQGNLSNFNYVACAKNEGTQIVVFSLNF